MGDKKRGLYRKFIVKRTDGKSEDGEKHEGCEYFVLDLTHDQHAIPAIIAYAKSCGKDGYRELAVDIRKLIPRTGAESLRVQSILDELAESRLGALGNFDFIAHLHRQREFSERTFGPGTRAKGVVDHIRKELKEVETNPSDLSEWIDVAILALDGAWRAGYSPEEIVAALVAKQTKNEGRKYPDWRTVPTDKAIEHVRSADEAPSR